MSKCSNSQSINFTLFFSACFSRFVFLALLSKKTRTRTRSNSDLITAADRIYAARNWTGFDFWNLDFFFFFPFITCYCVVCKFFANPQKNSKISIGIDWTYFWACIYSSWAKTTSSCFTFFASYANFLSLELKNIYILINIDRSNF